MIKSTQPLNRKTIVGRGAKSNWIPVIESDTGWLLFKYDPARDLIEIQRRGRKTLIDLSQCRDKTTLDKS